MHSGETQLGIALQHEIPHLRVSTRWEDRVSYGRDMSPGEQIRIREGIYPPLSGAVVFPRTVEEVVEIYRFAHRRRTPVVPVGGLSGVCGGAVPEEGCIQMDLKGLSHLLEIYPMDLLLDAGAGWIGAHLEEELNRRGYTLGHFPSSIMTSTLGGWFATRSAGQMSTLYGKFEDLVRGVEWVFPDGTLYWFDRDGPGAGMIELLMGSEGTLGTATRIRLRIHPLPEERAFQAYLIKGVSEGLRAIEELMEAGVFPAVVRLYDPLDTFLSRQLLQGEKKRSLLKERGGRFSRRFKELMFLRLERLLISEPGFLERIIEFFQKELFLILVHQGSKERVQWEVEESSAILKKYGTFLGDAPARRWFEHRYSVSYGQIRVFTRGGFVDTMEVAFPWSTLEEGYHAVRRVLKGEVLLLAHFSHFYPHGGSIYFTFIGYQRKRQDAENLYREVWRRGLDTVLSLGGTITHHHGVGLLKAKWLRSEWGEAYGYLRRLKQVLDPFRIANPNKLGI